MIVRKAVASDAERVHRIAESLRINWEHPQENGFLVYVLSPEQYRNRIEISPNFYVAEDGGEIHGFLMCYDCETLKVLKAKGGLDYDGGVADFVFQQQSPYIVGDQIGVQPDQIRRGIGKAMMSRLFEDMKKQGIQTMYVSILHKPISNKPSVDFCNGLGFVEIKEVTNRDGLVWGVYRLGI